eukprot:TRINITY_DN7801_c0_g1_i2.p2 TRINITY_DN7801_c0_g1~~TRINITY_DN7801_c0_g1_i2.p2  ORF type:complete len:101 (+),score=8.43 TRINITY_DN7801_c0_g1_i2:102-404(+)
MVAIETGYINHIKDLESMELGAMDQEDGLKLCKRVEEKEVLDSPLDEVLERFPGFRGNFQACDIRRRTQLRQWWTQQDSRLNPLIKACADLGNFDIVLEP